MNIDFIKNRLRSWLEITQPKRRESVPFTPAAFFGQEEPTFKTTQAQIQAYRSWAYACIRLISSRIANINLKLFKKTANGKEEIEQHDILDLIAKANDHMTDYDLFEITSIFLELTGESYWWKIKSEDNKIISLYPWFSPVNMKVVAGSLDESFIKGYVYEIPGSAQKIPFDNDEILYFKFPNPENAYRGLAPMKAAEWAVANDREGSKWNHNFFLNSARYDLALETEGTLSQDQYERIKSQWEAGHQGTDNAHKIAILEGGLKANKMSLSQKEMDFSELKKLSRDEIFTVFGVPKGVITAEDVNRATALTHERTFIINTVKPKMTKIVKQMNEFLIPDFGEDKLFLDFEDPTPRDREVDIKFYDVAVKNAIMTPNEIREIEKLPPIEGGDQLYIANTVSPVGEQQQEPSKNLKFGNIKKYRRTQKEKIKDIITKEVKSKISELNKSLKKKKQSKFSENHKDMIWRQKLVKLETKEAVMRKELIEIFTDQEKRVKISIRKITKQVTWEANFNPKRELEAFIDVFPGILEDIVEEHGKNGLALLGLENVISFDITPKMERFILRAVEMFAKNTNKITQKKLAKTLKQAGDAGEEVQKVIKRIEKVFTQARGPRAKMIARSEVSRAANFGTIESYKQSKVVKGKEWLTALDERVCPYCMPMHGKSVKLKTKFFKKGDSFQGDAKTPLPIDYTDINFPPLHPQCRCTIIPIV